MFHLGDITKIDGSKIPAVDCIIGGSPCQDLSVAGKRAGLKGERSGLFMQQIRVVKEMREKDAADGRAAKFIRPRYMVWENVPGAFSSNNGEDFRAVLEETARISESGAVIPKPAKGWRNAGIIMGRGWSISWRVHDAQFWGVPQRRRRIALIADFNGETAPEILFERKSMPRDITAREKPREGIAETVGRSIDSAISFQERAGKPGGGKGILIQTEHVGALSTVNKQIVLYDAYKHHKWRKSETCGTLTTNNGHVQGNTPLIFGQTSFGDYENKTATIRASGGDFGGGSENLCVSYQSTTGPLMANTHPGSYAGQDAYNDMFVVSPVVRRLTPLECERLQGFPDGWTDIGAWIDSKGKLHKEATDSARYKALGNSIALPFWQWLLDRISKQYDRPATLGSLFDGIGGFPLCWERANGKGTAIWASEIEEFPIAVTKYHFKERGSK